MKGTFWIGNGSQLTPNVANILTTHFQIDNVVIQFNRNDRVQLPIQTFPCIVTNQTIPPLLKNNDADLENKDDRGNFTLTEMLKQLPASCRRLLLQLLQMTKLAPQCLQLHRWGWEGQLPRSWDSDCCRGKPHCQLCSSAVYTYNINYYVHCLVVWIILAS